MIRQHCELKGITLAEIIKDEGVSGFKSNRPGFVRLQAMCRARETNMVIVYDLSRLSRSVRDTLAFIEDVIQKHSVNFVSLTQDVDTSTPMGRAFLGFTSIFNQLYRDEISFKTRLAIRHKRDKGERYSGSIPYGFTATDDGRLIESEADRDLLDTVGQLHTSGLSLRAIGRELQNRGIRTKKGHVVWNAKTVSSLVSRVTGGD